MLQEISRIGVKTSVSTKALEITEQGVLVEIDGKTEEIEADSVVMAVGSQSCNPLQAVVEEMGIPCQVAGVREFGESSTFRTILQKGDNFRLPGMSKPQRYAQPTATSTNRPNRPR